MKLQSSYLELVYDPKNFQALIKRASKKIVKLKKQIHFDAIAFTGSSGAAVAYPISALTGIRLAHVRKVDGCHSVQLVEGKGYVRSYVILDDFISTGETIRRIRMKMNQYCAYDERAKCKAIFLYNNSYYDKSRTFFEGVPIFCV